MQDRKEAMYERFLHRLGSDPLFVGHALNVYELNHHLDDTALAGILGCQSKGLARLKACLAPDPKKNSFKADIQRIADFAKCDPTQLLIVIREFHLLESLRRAPQTGEIGIAARDRQDKEPPETD